MANQNCLQQPNTTVLSNGSKFFLLLLEVFSWHIVGTTILCLHFPQICYIPWLGHWGKKHFENSPVKGISSWCIGYYLLKVHSNTPQRSKSRSEEWSMKSEQKCDFSEVTGTTSWNWMSAQNIGINTPALACQCPKILQALARKSLTCFVGPNAIELVLLQLHCSACSLQVT